ncbi:ankyrin repeat protein [Pedobacter cryoconitis]|uniref:ankyrin repeat domain-containing protein n=1 Tax=Pedobacter cryoconitis TaxID=188932 RepID=UPI00161CF6FB|nr:ankyrin repeat domain-containing protein [Pedobacter cryoconitis]MBB6273910.1 ankyrin repeat protein [Pedobacter cryoconitis]
MTKNTEIPALRMACYQQDIALVQQLLLTVKPVALNKKLVDYDNPVQGTPLQLVCKNGNLNIVKLLIEAGADKEVKDVARQSPLSIAVSNGHYDIIDYLIEIGADIYSKGPDNLQPIHFASVYGSRKIIELLLLKGVDVNLVDGLKSSLLDFTTNLEGGNLDAAKTLVENGISNRYFPAAFKWACWRNNPAIAKYLLDCGTDFRGETTPKSELLFWICSLGHKDIVELLLEVGVDFKTKVKFKGKMMSYNGSPLDRAIETGQTEIVNLINSFDKI